jgi:hypothetical protein
VADYCPDKLQQIYRTVCENAGQIGMKVNKKKTTLMCFGVDQSVDLRARITCSDGGVIESVSSAKVVGFHFDQKLTANRHVEEVIKKANRNLWVLRNLRKAGATKNDMTTAYKLYIRSGLEYSSVIYHTLLTKAQSAALEKIQERALRVIYGWSMTYDKILETTAIDLLHVRREQAVQKFAEKIEKSARFSEKWLKVNENRTSARFPKTYDEPFARTSVFKNDPVNNLIKVLNNVNNCDTNQL